MINERLKAIRQATGLSQQDFSNGIGLEQGSYSGVESGRKGSITKQTAMLLELVYNVNMEFLYHGIGEMFIIRETQQLQKTSITEDPSLFYERMIDKKDKRIEELVLLIGQLQQEVKTLRQDKKIAHEMDDVLNVAEKLKPTGTEDR